MRLNDKYIDHVVTVSLYLINTTNNIPEMI